MSSPNYRGRAEGELQRIIENTLAMGTDEVALEWVPEGLEVSYLRDNAGVGSILKNSKLAGELVASIVQKAGLEQKNRGKVTVTARGQSHALRVEQYDSFGESTFRLTFAKSGK